uniref:Uncharacterized protein n=1 Tax=Utricularia reniformis TaxID=192314 RepID=A0A1Y0B2B8_9LAMI|nr:hypothetical protein AEK19_MT1336 [Utricularia reniformis]ART31534.1 hypothetical protein AEK19_MT1336 [Utricularia reniformis]
MGGAFSINLNSESPGLYINITILLNLTRMKKGLSYYYYSPSQVPPSTGENESTRSCSQSNSGKGF